ncbi:centrosomal protein of 162 kDa isoform X1 [Gorilla gorilla gorilla]|uniref:centrosomal protein of 162 kDa isoform X1 n=2 Tax=Gorilla gorilla gorilla TaxID=9595 RepID=UPI002445D30A|nr:centrosomal protein of 162 kDa isoform X1 [Gorilla gorilla gorilla]XP_055247957.1 centrosomal protein of 162 kDa isoform X1 [Gorilla gorilla gorilla]
MANCSQEELDEEFEQFMKELSDDSFENSDKTARQSKKEMKKKDTVPWWITEDDFKDDGLLGTNVSYLKTKKTSQAVMEIEEESAEKIQFLKSSGTSLLSTDSLETNELVVSELNHSSLGVGLDTLEEQEEKEQFFARLEKGLTSSIDYSRLNKELDSNDSTHFKALHSNQANAELTDDEHENESKHEELAENYSDDFEDEYVGVPLTTKDEEMPSKENSKSEKISMPKQEEEKTGMLANVVLLDSLDSVAEVNLDEQDKITPKPRCLPEMTENEMTGTGVSYGQSSSDVEALHQAYCHIAHSLGDEDKQKIESNTVKDIKSSVKGHPQENEENSKNISTMESDLPTVEELMKPIRIDSFGISGFDLQPVSSEKVAERKETEFFSSLPLKTNPNILSQDSQHVNLFFDKNDENVILQKTTNESMENSCPQVTATEEHVDKMYLNILRKKISVNSSSLFQDDKINKTYRSQLSSEEEGAVMGKQVPYKKARSAPPLLKRKPQSGLYASVRSSGYGKPSSPLKMFSTLEKKTSEDVIKSKNLRSISTSNQPRKKEILSGTKLIKPAALDKPAHKTESCLSTRKKSENPTETDSCIQFQTNSLGYCGENKEKELLMFKRVQEAEEKWRGAQALIEQIKATFSEKEKELENKLEELKKQQEKELFKLNQDNYILQAKLSSFEETNKKQRWLHFGEAADPVTGEKLKQIQKEIQEQETLLQGYQQENERLYNQVKDLQEQNKKNEERMFKENQSLFSEVASLKEQMHKSRFLSQVVEDSEPTRNQNFTDLLAELRMAQKEKDSLLEDIKRLKQDKQALEVDFEKMKKERDQAKDQIAYVTGEKLYEIKILEETHKQEISRLQKRLQWYAENQELLDKDALRLREANEEIEKLKLEIEKLKAESGNPSIRQKIRLKDKAADAKKIQDLERQVKEMEGILKRRYPNSLPALILAASAAGDTVDKNTVEFMEKRIKKLEADLEGKDEDAKKSLRTMEQQFQKMKIQYEQRLEQQEQLLACKLNQHDSPRIKALEKELDDIKEAHQITVRNLEAEIDVLKHQNAELDVKKNDKDDKDFQSIEFQVEQAHAKAKLVRLNEELAAKKREIQDLSKTVERLQKDRRMMLSNQNSKGREEMSAKRAKKDVLHSSKGNANSYFPGTLDSKLYQPHTFTDSHVSEVLQENYRLKNEIEGLISEKNELKMKSEAAMNQFENSMRRVKEDTAAHIASLKASHQREIEKLLCQNAVENSSSKVAELNRKIATQEVLIRHFQSQVNELQSKQESLVVSEVREEILQKEITKLLEELREAKENHTPEMKHFVGLEKKIKQMEMRHAQREQELQQIIQQTHQVVETEQNKEVEKWKRLAQLKNRELEKFRTELDSILDVLRELHRQGVVVPVAFADEMNAPEY